MSDIANGKIMWGNEMEPSEWKVVYHYRNGTRTSRVVTGFFPLLHSIRQARATIGIHIVEVGPKIGPALTVFGIARGETDE